MDKQTFIEILQSALLCFDGVQETELIEKYGLTPELARYKQDTEGKSELTDNDCIAITKELGETEWQILEEIKHEQKTSTQLSAILDKPTDTIKEHYKPLKKHNLIETKTGQGVSLSIRGVRFVRWGMLSAGGLGDKNTPNENDSGKKTHQPTSKNEYLSKYQTKRSFYCKCTTQRNTYGAP